MRGFMTVNSGGNASYSCSGSTIATGIAFHLRSREIFLPKIPRWKIQMCRTRPLDELEGSIQSKQEYT